MKTIETRRCEMLGRVVEFGEKYGHLFPKSSEAGETFAAVAAAVKQLGEHTRSKLSSDRSGKGNRTIARAALLERLDAMARVARTIGETTPGFEADFDLPDQPTDQELIETGRLFMQHAEDVKKLFIAKAFPTTFIADITELVDAFEQSVRERDAEQVQNANARASLGTALEAGLAAVRTLDVMMRVALKDDPAMTATWNKARRVSYPNRGKAVGPVAVTPVAASVPPATPAAASPQPTPAPVASTPAAPTATPEPAKAVA